MYTHARNISNLVICSTQSTAARNTFRSISLPWSLLLMTGKCLIAADEKRMEFGPHRRCGRRIWVAYTRSVRPNLVVVPRMYSVCIWWQLTTTHIMIAQCDFKSQIRVLILFGRKKNQKYGHEHRRKRRGSGACILCRLCSFQPEDSVLAIASWMIL